MSASVPISKAAPKSVQFNWWQEGKAARLDCTGFTCTVAETSLPYPPTIVAVDLVLGKFRMLAPDPVEAAKLKLGAHYGLQLVLWDGGGAPVIDRRLMIEVV